MTKFECTPRSVPYLVNKMCAICHDDYFDELGSLNLVVRTISCHHYFHHFCLLQWLAVTHMEGLKGTCPSCRHVLYRSMQDIQRDDYSVEALVALTVQVYEKESGDSTGLSLAEMEQDLLASDFTEMERQC